MQQQLLAWNPRLPASAAAGRPWPAPTAMRSGRRTSADFQVPACPSCGGVLKPAVVFFGENVPRAPRGRRAGSARQADALLVVGSSLMVFSGYRFCLAARAAGQPVAAVNLGRTRADDLLTLKVEEDCCEALAGRRVTLKSGTAC